MKNLAKCLTLAALVAAALMIPLGAQAHDLWVTTPGADPGQNLIIELGYGHAFPQGEPLDAKLIVVPRVVSPAGVIQSKPVAEMKYESLKPLAKGSYVVTAGREAQWYTKSPEGSVNKPKDQVQGALRCVRTVKYGKAIVNVGGALDDVSKPVGTALEIVPLANPGSIAAGGELPVQVLLNGKPLAKTEVMATFAGFTPEGRSMAFYAKTDKKGMVKVKLWHSGLWLVRAYHKEPYKDPAKCDTFGQTAVLTFRIK
ncbi:MAG: DUF4198 domain-containing protein [Deltaproteobacteria bacterium]|nr:DUF4198 domain-containing protein [Deltaproteobacteria bacterium]